MNVASLVEIKKNPKIPDIAPGDTVRVSVRIVEGGKERIQVFQGVIIKIRLGGAGASFTVRHVAFGIGVERTFPLYSSLVEKVEIVRQGKVRRARLYYLRGLSGKEAHRKIKRVERKLREQVGEELLQSTEEEVVEPMPAEAAVEEAPQAEAAEEKPAAVETAPEPEAAAEEAPQAEAVEEKPAAVETAPEPEAVVEEAPQAEAVEEKPAAVETAPEPEAVAEEAPQAEAVEEKLVAEAAPEPPAEDNKETA